jgi:LytS/YehU family sensor histidine kinase
MVTELAEFLRYSLISKNFANVPLKDELEAMKHYLAIEKTRYEEKLEIDLNIDPAAEEYPVLSFMLHPIIENAIKYGMKTSELPLMIKISAIIQNEKLLISVFNSGGWYKHEENDSLRGTGTGLLNVKQRLESAFPNRFKFDIEKGNNNVIIKIEIDS